MTEDRAPLSGRFVRVPTEFVDRSLHPWMTSAAWRESYIRLHRNKTFTMHDREVGQRTIRLYEGQVLVSVAWLCETCPEMTEKSARIFLDYLENPPDGSPPLIAYPGGKRRGARYQIARLLESWAPTKTQIKEQKRQARARSKDAEGRTRQPRKRKRDTNLDSERPSEGRQETAMTGEVEASGASPMPSGANSAEQAEVQEASGANLNGAGSPTGTTHSYWPDDDEGRTPENGEGGGVGGEGDGEARASPPEKAIAFSSPPQVGQKERDRRGLDKRTADELLAYAARYCAPEGRAVPLRNKEIIDLRGLIDDLWTVENDADGVREFFVRARRWADSPEVQADRMNASFVRANQNAIRRQTALTLQEERRIDADRRKASARRDEYDQQQEYAKWLAGAEKAWKAEPEEARAGWLEQAEAKVERPAVETELAEKFRALAVRTTAMELFNAERGNPAPRRES